MYRKKVRLVNRYFCIILIFILLLLSNIISYNNFQTTQNEIDKALNNPISTSVGEFTNINSPDSGGSRSSSANYSYHNYSTLVSGLQQLNTTYPDLLEVFTTQDLFGLPDCVGGYKIWLARITNEKLGYNKPEVLFIGGHHGDEDISIEAPYYLIEFLLENYASNPNIQYLLDHREIYVMPVLNPWGWENNIRENGMGEDVNRDYPYGIEAGNTPLTTVGASSVTELMKRHLFITSVSWHSGLQAIYYAWGTPKHDTPSDESPDNIAFFEVAKLMSEFAGGQNTYPYGPTNQVVYYAEGAWSDYAYAATWDTKYLTSGHETPGARSLAMGIEISTTKAPAQSALGNPEEVFNPGSNIGLIPQNLRMALIMIDLAEPYLTWSNQDPNAIPTQVDIDSNITFNWSVNGTFSVTGTKLLYGTDPDPINNYQFNSTKISGGSVWSAEAFSQTITVPNQPGDYYFVAQAIVDQSSLVQSSPDPEIPPQSFFVNQRTNNIWSVTNNGNSINGKKEWYSSTIHIKVQGRNEEKIKISNYSSPAHCNEIFNITWEAKSDQELTLNNSRLFWGQNNDLINHSEFTTLPLATSYDSKNETIKYYASFTLPAKPGNYYFITNLKLENSANGAKNYTDYWSEVLKLEVTPRIPYKLHVNIPEIKYENPYQQTLTLKGINCINQNISDKPLDNSLMITAQAKIVGFDYNTKEIFTDKENNYGLMWSVNNETWHLPTVSISSWDPGWYLVSCLFEHKYGLGQSSEKINDELNNWFKLEHIITVSKPIVNLSDNDTKILDITDVTAWCSKSQIGTIENLEASSHSYEVYRLSTKKFEFNGVLEWSTTNNSWHSKNVNVSELGPGNYFIICKFSITGIGSGESIHSTGDQTEFTLSGVSDDRKNDGDNGTISDEYLIIMVLVVIIIIILLFIMIFIRIRKTF